MTTLSNLTPEQAITAAYMHYCRGITQEDLAAVFNVNQGRVNEFCKAIKMAADDPRAVRPRKVNKKSKREKM